MPETTQTEPSVGTPTGYGFCSWHHRFASSVRLIAVDEQASGGGTGVQYACPPCIEANALTPSADQP